MSAWRRGRQPRFRADCHCRYQWLLFSLYCDYSRRQLVPGMLLAASPPLTIRGWFHVATRLHSVTAAAAFPRASSISAYV